MRLPLALFVVALTVSGCDRFAAEPPGTDPVVDPGPAQTIASAYIKGPGTLVRGRALPYRAEPIHGATRYTWIVLRGDAGNTAGTGDATLEIDGNERLIQATGRVSGPVVFQVTAYGPDGPALARGTRTFTVE